jgi:hypothetical protein
MFAHDRELEPAVGRALLATSKMMFAHGHEHLEPLSGADAPRAVLWCDYLDPAH